MADSPPPVAADSSSLTTPEKQSLGQSLKELGGPIVGSIVVSVIGMGVVTLVCLWLGVFGAVGAAGSWERGLYSAPFVLLLCGALTVVLAVKRAVFTGLVHGAQKLSLGKRLSGLVFDNLLGVDGQDGGAVGERGNRLAKAAEKLPLAEAETRLRQAIARLKHSAEQGGVTGFFAGRLHGALLDKIEAVTLAQFRTQGASAGGVDLVKLRDELSRSADGLVTGRLRSARRQLTALLVLGAALGSFLLGKVVGWFL